MLRSEPLQRDLGARGYRILIVEGALRIGVLTDLFDGHPAQSEEDAAALFRGRARRGVDFLCHGFRVSSLKRYGQQHDNRILAFLRRERHAA
jgi:hypothetical protein